MTGAGATPRSEPLRVAVVGLGAMGSHHIRILASLDDAELVGAADPRPEQRALAERRYRVATFDDHIKMFDVVQPDAISIAVPTTDHFAVAAEALQRGIHVLVEKPIASTVEEALALIGLAETSGVVLGVGHIERFNPAIWELKRRLAAKELGEVFLIGARRMGPFPMRIGDVGVVTDLAPHDLDVMRYVLGDEVDSLVAETARRVHASHEDLLAGMVRFRGGILGRLDIDWLTPTKIREITVTGERGMFRVDYVTQDFFIFENSYVDGEAWDTIGILRGVSEGRMMRIPIERREPLHAELSEFVRACQQRGGVVVSGSDATMALYLSELMLQSSNTHEWMTALNIDALTSASEVGAGG